MVSMVVALNKLPMVVAGIVMFNVPVTLFSLSAVLIGLCFIQFMLTKGLSASIVCSVTKSGQMDITLPQTSPKSDSTEKIS